MLPLDIASAVRCAGRRKNGLLRMTGESVDLESLLDYELRCSKRYRRPICLLMIAAVNTDISVKSLLDATIRQSDELFELREYAAILMGETDPDGALTAISRHKEAYGKDVDLRFGLASFPKDGSSVADLLAAAHRRLDKALALDRGAVVSDG